MRIAPTRKVNEPLIFRHAGELRIDTFDPRKPIPENDEEVEIDLRECDFVFPAAALWCVVYLMLASKQGSHCRLLVPNNMAVCQFLKTLRLFDILKDHDVDVDDRNIRAGSADKTIVPITRFDTATDASTLTNDIFAGMQSFPNVSAGLTQVVAELFGELAMNAAQHSESPIGSFGCVQFVDTNQGSRFVCVVADGGIGVYKSLTRNPAYRKRVNYDWDALELAIRERVSGTTDPHRGIGLYGVSEDVRQPKRSLLLHSGIGSLEITEELESHAKRTRLFPGTLAFLSIPA